MSELEIPEAAYDVAEQVSKTYVANVDALDVASDVINVAAPLIVAAELRRQAAEWLTEARTDTGAFNSRNYAAIKIATNKIVKRADELDPERRTR